MNVGFKIVWKVVCRFFGRGYEEQAVKKERDCGYVAKVSNRAEHPSHIEWSIIERMGDGTESKNVY